MSEFKLTKNYDTRVTKDGEHFTVHNATDGSLDGGYRLGQWVDFQDNGTRYAATVIRSDSNYKVLLKKV